jgi:RNA polymerase sigma-70 factor (ECF subfamily)
MQPRHLIQLIDEHSAALVLFARQWCDGPEDAVQDAFCKLASITTPPDDAVAWLFRVVRNRAIDLGKSRRRRRNREQVVARPERWFAEPALGEIDSEEVMLALQELPDEQREVIVMRLWGEMTLEQIAATLGCSISTVHRRYEAGIAALQARFAKELVDRRSA